MKVGIHWLHGSSIGRPTALSSYPSCLSLGYVKLGNYISLEKVDTSTCL